MINDNRNTETHRELKVVWNVFIHSECTVDQLHYEDVSNLITYNINFCYDIDLKDAIWMAFL